MNEDGPKMIAALAEGRFADSPIGVTPRPELTALAQAVLELQERLPPPRRTGFVHWSTRNNPSDWSTTEPDGGPAPFPPPEETRESAAAATPGYTVIGSVDRQDCEDDEPPTIPLMDIPASLFSIPVQPGQIISIGKHKVRVLDDEEQAARDAEDYGIGILKDGKRVDPNDFYADPPEKQEWPIDAEEQVLSEDKPSVHISEKQWLRNGRFPNSPATRARTRDRLEKILHEELILHSGKSALLVNRILDELIEIDVPIARGGGSTIASAVYRGTLRDVKEGRQ